MLKPDGSKLKADEARALVRDFHARERELLRKATEEETRRRAGLVDAAGLKAAADFHETLLGKVMLMAESGKNQIPLYFPRPADEHSDEFAYHRSYTDRVAALLSSEGFHWSTEKRAHSDGLSTVITVSW